MSAPYRARPMNPNGVDIAREITRAANPANIDAIVANNMDDPESATSARLNAAYAPVAGAGVARFIARAKTGEDLAITCLGDSVPEGQTVTDPATDGFMIVLAEELSSRFGITVTQTNHATSGFTTLRGWADGNVAAAIADNADVYFVTFGKNDIGSDIAAYVPGYPIDASVAAFERMVREIRTKVPKADIVLWSENPYTAGSTSNPYLRAYNTRIEQIAAAYGCEWVDCYQAFTDLGDYSAYLYDGTHPNTAGHRLIADTMLTHFPTTGTPVPVMSAQPGATGLNTPMAVAGYVLAFITGSVFPGGVTWANVGTWSGAGGAGSPYTTSTPNSHADFTVAGPELHVLLSTTTADAAVCDIVIDGVTVASNQRFDAGKQGYYYVPIAVGMAAGATHTVSLILKSGTLRIQRIAALCALPTTMQALTVDLTGTVSVIAIDAAGATTYAINVANLFLPVGWASMDVIFTGYIQYRSVGPTTATHKINTVLRVGGVVNANLDQSFPTLLAASTDDEYRSVPISTDAPGITATRTQISLEAKQTGTEKSGGQIRSWQLRALCVRTS